MLKNDMTKNRFFGKEEISEEKNEPSAREEAEIAISELRNKYSENLRKNFELTAEKLRRERDNAIRENWILQQQAEAALPEKMAASGINGGASETGIVNLRARYQDGRNDIENGFMDDLEELSQKNMDSEGKAQQEYNMKWLEYLLSLAKAEGGR